VRLIELDEYDWQVSVEKFRDVLNSSTKMIILNNPSNPTGTQYSRCFLNALIEICKPYGTYPASEKILLKLDVEIPFSYISLIETS